MSEKQKKIVHLIYGITLSLLIVVVAICLTVACVMIAKKAPSGAFTKDAIYSAFLVVIAPFSVCVLGIIGGGVLHAVFPAKEEIRASVPSKYRPCRWDSSTGTLRQRRSGYHPHCRCSQTPRRSHRLY